MNENAVRQEEIDEVCVALTASARVIDHRGANRDKSNRLRRALGDDTRHRASVPQRGGFVERKRRFGLGVWIVK